MNKSKEYVTPVHLMGSTHTSEILNWLDVNCGSRGSQWDWLVRSANGVQNSIDLIETVEFANRRHQLMFSIAWGGVCKEVE